MDNLNKIIAQKSYFASLSNLTPSSNTNVMQINEISNLINTVNSLNSYLYTITFYF